MSVKIINEQAFEQLIKEDKPLLLDFYADWCGPCRMVGPIVEEIAQQREDVNVAKINVDNEPDLANKFGIVSIPTLIVIKNGEVVNKAIGARSKEGILALIDG